MKKLKNNLLSFEKFTITGLSKFNANMVVGGDKDKEAQITKVYKTPPTRTGM